MYAYKKFQQRVRGRGSVACTVRLSPRHRTTLY
jgi:hypothetical protein